MTSSTANGANRACQRLSTNGLKAVGGFPVDPYERVHALMASRGSDPLYKHYAGAWNALAYRFRAAVDSAEQFATLLRQHGASPAPEARYLQERALFDFYSSGFSVFECTFYALYTFGALLEPNTFSLASERAQQQVSPSRTREAFKRAFPRDPIVATVGALFADPEYQKWREVRNVLTHRTAPGRTVYVSIGQDDTPPTEWKLNNSPLDESISADGARELSRLITLLVTAAATFVESRFS